MNCQTCSSDRIMNVYAKSSDLNSLSIKGHNLDHYLPDGIGLGDDSDAVSMDYCLNCGQIQGEFPLPITNLEVGRAVDEDDLDDLSDEEKAEEEAKKQDEIRFSKSKFEWFNGVVIEVNDGSNQMAKQVFVTTLDDFKNDPNPPALQFIGDNICSDFPFGLALPFKVRFLCNVSEAQDESELIVKNAIWQPW
jgi:hypothetical protein